MQGRSKLKRNDQQKLQQAMSLVRAGNPESAQVLCTKLLRKNPRQTDVLHLLGIISFKQMKLDAAAELMLKAVQSSPGNPIYYCELARIEQKRGRPEAALENYRLALQKPLSVPVYSEIGSFCFRYGEIALAADCFSHALQLQPHDSLLINNLAKCYFDLLQTDKAERLYRQNLQRTPTDLVSLNNLATILRCKGETEAGVALFTEPLRLSPDDLELKATCAKYLLAINHGSAGEALLREILAEAPLHQGATLALGLHLANDRLSEAMSIMQAFITTLPGNAEGHRAQARLLARCGRTEASEQHFAKALQIAPDDIDHHESRVFSSNYLPVEQQDAVCQHHKDAAAALMRHLFCRPFPPVYDPDPQRPLTIAYMSPNLHQHSVAYFIEPLLRGHDRNQFRVIVYSDSATLDTVNRRLRGLADQWYDVTGCSDNALRGQIARDRVDVLIELAGHTGHNRLGVLASVAAPVQVSYLGYPNHIALPSIQYRISDQHADPLAEKGEDWHQTLHRLPGGFLCFQPDANAPDVAPSPLSRNGYVTFGCFNVREKLSVQTLLLWARILDAVPSSRLLLKSVRFSDPEIRRCFVEQCGLLGIAEERLQVLGRIEDNRSHLALYDEMDIALDPTPYNGTTTTCESLWMGVPVVTVSGDRHAARVGSSLLHQVGLAELVARDESDYLQIATLLADDPDRLQRLRSTMRERMRTSPLMDEPRICREMETAYRNMWQSSCLEVAG